MELTVWTYEGPPHVGAMRIATSMEGVHYVLHAPQGDTYADLLFTMIERRDRRPNVSYTTFQARDLAGDTAGLVQEAVQEAFERFKPQVMLVGESCTAELIQDQPGSLAVGMNLPIPVVPLELPSYSKKENWGASETFYALVRALLRQQAEARRVDAANAPVAVNATEATPQRSRRPSVNILGPSALGFRCRDDVEEIRRLLGKLGVDVNIVAPEGATAEDLMRIPEADANVCLYPEIAQSTCKWLEKTFDQPWIRTVPIGVGATRDFIKEIGQVLSVDVESVLDLPQSRLPWYSRSVDSTYLTGKRVFVFGDATHVLAATRVADEEMGFTVVGVGTYSREFAREVRALAEKYDVEALITDDYLAVEARVEALQPELVLGTQMERHLAKRMGIACSVISAPVHVQDFPARYSPQMGFEGANVLFDTWVHPLMMGLEEHLLGMFRDDFEFGDGSAPSHLHSEGGTSAQQTAASNGVESIEEPSVTAVSAGIDPQELVAQVTDSAAASLWSAEAERELKKIPFFVRGKARRNTERYAAENGLTTISLETLYDAKAHYGK